MLFQRIDRDFDPLVDDATMRQWFDDLGYDGPPPEVTAVDPSGELRQTLVDQLLPLGSDIAQDYAREFSFPADSYRIPLIRIVLGTSSEEEEVDAIYANPLRPDGVFGESYCHSSPVEAKSSSETETVKLALDIVKSTDPGTKISILDGEWGAEELVGRRVVMSFMPLLDESEFLGVAIDDISLFTPVFRVEGPDVDEETAEKLSKVGDTISRHGDVLSVTDDGAVSFNGESLGAGPTPENLAKRVTRLEAVVDTGTCDEIQIQLNALDDEGDTVPGLGADAFGVSLNERVVPFLLNQNTEQAPRVLFIFDTSDSVPEAFRDENATRIALDISTEILSNNAGAEFRSSLVGASGFLGDWVGSIDDFEAQLLRIDDFSWGSPLWKSIAAANSPSPPSVVIVITDGDATDEPTEEFKAQIASGPPVITVGVGPFVQEFLDQVSSLSGGASFSVDNRDDLVSAVLAHLENARVSYILSLPAENAVYGDNIISIAFDHGRLGDDIDFQHSSDSVCGEDTIAGMFLTVEVGDRKMTRSIAGMYEVDSRPVDDITETMLQEVENLLWGRITIAVEAAQPTLSTLLSDFFTERLRIEDLWSAYETGDFEQLFAEIRRKPLSPPKELYLFNMMDSDSVGDDFLTFQHGLRVMTYTETPDFDEGIITRSFDIFPMNIWGTATDDRLNGWQKTLEHTANLAIAESAFFEKSTLALLEEQSLAACRASSLDTSLFSELPLEERRRWGILGDSLGYDHWALAPENGTPHAFWALNDKTGCMIGILDNLTGGGRTDEIIQEFQEIAAMIDLYDGAFSSFVPGGATWIELEKVKLAIVLRATIAIATMQAPEEDILGGAINDRLADIASDQMEAGLGAMFPPIGTWIKVKDKVETANNFMIVGMGLIR